MPRCFLSLCFAVDAFDERAIFLEDFCFEVCKRLSQIIHATLPSGVTGEAVVAFGVTISVGFLIPDAVPLLCWSNFCFSCQFWLVSSPTFTCSILISSAFFFSLFLHLFKPWSFLPSTALIFFLSRFSAFLFCSYSRYLAVLSSLFCLSNFLWSHIAFCLFCSLSFVFSYSYSLSLNFYLSFLILIAEDDFLNLYSWIERTNILQICVYVP